MKGFPERKREICLFWNFPNSDGGTMSQIPLLILAAISQPAHLPVENGLHWNSEQAVVSEFCQGLYSVFLPDFNSQGESGVHLPEKTVMLPVPVTGDVTVSVVPAGIRSLGTAPPVAMSVFEDGGETFVEAPSSALPDNWGGIVDRGTFRRAGYVLVRLNPVIVSDGELLAADLEIVLDHSDASRAETVRGHEGDIFGEVFGTNAVWREPVSRALDSPFWGRPWARIQVDTAGVFQLTGEMIPEAVGMPSGSFSMITGRGKMMNSDEPANDSFQPRPVPVYIEDGGDGTFDTEDTILFYGRGLSWWDNFMENHFNSRYSHENTYWLTWGGEGGPFMDVLDGSVTGAPSAGTSYVNMLHFEENQTLAPSYGVFQDQYGWHRIASSVPANYSFSTPGVIGGGSMKLHFYMSDGSNVEATATVNGIVAADTVLKNSGDYIWEFPVGNFETSGNSMSIRFDGSGHVIYTDWFEVFPETGYRSWSTMCRVPLDRGFPSGERRLVTWSQSLGSDAFVCIVQSDTAAAVVNIPGGKDFEVPMPSDWFQPVMWVVPGGSFLEPVSVTSASPGRILETISSGSTIYVYPDQFASDMPLFQRGRTDVQMLSLSEIYDEFNGGVRDPNAVRAFFAWAVNSWAEPPDQLVLVGDGHWDSRGFTTDKPCPMDIISYQFFSGHPVCTDHLYTSLTFAGLPEAAVSRIPVSTRTELQLVAQKSAGYSDPSQECGTWQSVVLGAGDDERSPKFPQYDETYHTEDAEIVMTQHVPDRLVPLRNYLIFYDWNSNWKKPECRTDFIENWSEGALAVFFLGHGSFDQIADEGLLYIEDTQALACGPRLPYAFFGSCDVGLFQNPSNNCIAEEVITSSAGGAIVSSGASCESYGGLNAGFLMEIYDLLLNQSQFTIGETQWLAMLNHGVYSGNDKRYIIFGDGSLNLALPDTEIVYEDPELYTSQLCEIQGSIPEEGLVMVTAWESAKPDSYFTHNDHRLIEYISSPGVFYRGLAAASTEFTASMFVPEVAAVGGLARIRLFAPGQDGGNLVCAYPEDLDYGTGSPGDTAGPDIDMWITGFRGVENPEVSGDVTFEALLFDDSGINLLPYPGNQLALYIDDSPLDVADWFTYQPGSATTGGIIYPIQELQPGDHTLRLRAADNQSNLSWEEMSFRLLEESSPGISSLFVYPAPATTVMSFNWIQSSAGPVHISIYSVSGRKIAEMGNLPGQSGYNQHNWDLTDEEGDRVASGMYIYVVSAGDSRVNGIATVAR